MDRKTILKTIDYDLKAHIKIKTISDRFFYRGPIVYISDDAIVITDQKDGNVSFDLSDIDRVWRV